MIFTNHLHADEYKHLKVDYAAKAQFVEKLSEIKITDISIEEQHLSDSLFSLFKNTKPKVNFVFTWPIRYQVDSETFENSPSERAKIDPLVSLQATTITLAKALDNLCGQAEYEWSIIENQKSKTYFVKVEPKSK